MMHFMTINEVIEALSSKTREVMFSEASDHLVRIDYDTAREIIRYLQDLRCRCMLEDRYGSES